MHKAEKYYRKTTNISHTLDNKIVDHSDVVEASPFGAAPTTSLFLTYAQASTDWGDARRDKKHLGFGIWYALY